MLLTYPYRPDPRVFREARTLIRHGVKVHLIAWDRDGDLPRHADENGIDVIRVGPKCPYRSAAKVVSRLPRFWFRALRASRNLDFDIIHCHDFDTLPLGLLLSRLRRRAVLYDAHDIYSMVIRKDVGEVSNLVWYAEKFMSRRANEIVTTNEKWADLLSIGREVKARVVTNSPDTGVLDGADAKEIRERHGLRGFVISYLGSLEPGRFVEELVTSVASLGKLTLAIGGSGTLRPIVEKAASASTAIKFLGTLDTDEALRVTLASDLVIVMLDPTNPNYRESIPVKVLDAMACGRPMVISQGLDISKKIDEIGCGFVIPYNAEAFKETIPVAMTFPNVLDEMGKKGRAYYDKELSWEHSRDELLKAYKALVGQF
jgi:glycosyltransferase involved in cell wall biosynthesis